MRWSHDHLIFVMGILILVRLHLYIESAHSSNQICHSYDINASVQDCSISSANAQFHYVVNWL